eukprot:scaffold48945_cov21-Prasinocladus_malaysianus.AAC.1
MWGDVGGAGMGVDGSVGLDVPPSAPHLFHNLKHDGVFCLVKCTFKVDVCEEDIGAGKFGILYKMEEGAQAVMDASVCPKPVLLVR